MKIIHLKWYNQLNYFTLNELWTSVSSRSITMHFFPTSSDRISGSSCFVDLLWLFCFSRQRSPDPDAPDPPIPLPLPIEKDPRSFFPFLYFVLFFPKQQIMEHRKLDLFFVSKITQQNLFKWFILLSSLSFKGNIKFSKTLVIGKILSLVNSVTFLLNTVSLLYGEKMWSVIIVRWYLSYYGRRVH